MSKFAIKLTFVARDSRERFETKTLVRFFRLRQGIKFDTVRTIAEMSVEAKNSPMMYADRDEASLLTKQPYFYEALSRVFNAWCVEFAPAGPSRDRWDFSYKTEVISASALVEAMDPMELSTLKARFTKPEVEVLRNWALSEVKSQSPVIEKHDPADLLRDKMLQYFLSTGWRPLTNAPYQEARCLIAQIFIRAA